jgi:hypothetical protein
MVRRTWLFCAVFALAAGSQRPAFGQSEIYDNGPINGNVDGWTINFGFAVSDSFQIANDNTTVSGLTFGGRLFPGDVLQSVEVLITSSEFGGATFFDQVENFTQSNCFSNAYGYNVCEEHADFSGPALAAGTYWLTLQNATVSDGDPVYWDENSGVGCQSPGCPSLASENEIGTIPSEAFTLFGSSSSGTGTTPEPAGIVLFGSGILGLAGMLRRRLF